MINPTGKFLRIAKLREVTVYFNEGKLTQVISFIPVTSVAEDEIVKALLPTPGERIKAGAIAFKIFLYQLNISHYESPGSTYAICN